MREHDVTALTAAELEAARRELAASLALARRGSPVCAPRSFRHICPFQCTTKVFTPESPHFAGQTTNANPLIRLPPLI